MEQKYSLAEVAVMAQCAHATVVASIKSGRLKASKQTILGNSWHWVCTAEQIEEFARTIKRRDTPWGPKKPRKTPVEKVLALADELGVSYEVLVRALVTRAAAGDKQRATLVGVPTEFQDVARQDGRSPGGPYPLSRGYDPEEDPEDGLGCPEHDCEV